jgi:CO/xanthine dehydrogenase FAD-binding subunit
MVEPKTYHRPESVDEALRLLVQTGQSGALLAGGTKLVARLNDEVTDVIDLQATGLGGIDVTQDWATIGAMTRLQHVVENQDLPLAVRETARAEGPNTLRNAATVGGTVATADWESELFAALLLYDAQVTVQTAGETCDVALADFAAAEYPDGIVTQVSITLDGLAVRERVARTPADRPIVAVLGRIDAAGKIKLAFCGLADRPVLLSTDELPSMEPPADFRGSTAYRREMAIKLAERVKQALAR